MVYLYHICEFFIAERVTLMEERRKNKRTAMESELLIKRLDDGANRTEVSVEVLDVSKTGLGFISDQMLQIGEIYEADLTIWTKEVLHVLLRIVRIELKERGYFYGAVFMGMSDVDAFRIEVYQAVHDDIG